MRRFWFGWRTLLGLGFAGPALGAAPQFELPIRCTPGEDCAIQNYVDRDPGPGWRDYSCGRLAYDGHRGTDFRLPSLRRMDEGVEVLAAAAGLVVGTRDGEPDLSLRDQAAGASDAKMAGNGVRISHGDGWASQYSHLRRGSLRVKPGQRVAAGEVLGLVGLSGHTEFPHLDFSVSQRGRVVDPFAAEAEARCGQPASTLWSPAALAKLGYRASGVLVAGFAPRILSQRELQRGDRFYPVLPAKAPAIVFQLELFGTRAGDREELSLTDPAGRVFATHRAVLAGDLALRRLHLGRRRSARAWPAGDYQAHYVLRRGEQVVAESRAALAVR